MMMVVMMAMMAMMKNGEHVIRSWTPLQAKLLVNRITLVAKRKPILSLCALIPQLLHRTFELFKW